MKPLPFPQCIPMTQSIDHHLGYQRIRLFFGPEFPHLEVKRIPGVTE